MSHKFVILDELMDQLEAAQSGLVPSSIIQSVVSGVQNVPSNIVQSRIGGNSSTAYTTLPLSPISDNCCIDKSYINLQFDCNFSIKPVFSSAQNEEQKVPIYIGFRDGAQLFNQIQILIENSAIWQTVYQREEALIAYNALPETEIRGNPQYASIDKLKENLNCPMKKVIITIPTATAQELNAKNIPVHLKFKMTVDLNRLTPLLSNLHFTTPHMGNLRIKLFLQQIEKALFICPDYSAIRTKNNQQSWQFYPFATLYNNGESADLLKVMKLFKVDGNGLANLTSLKIDQPPTGSDFISFKDDGLIEIVQTNFKIKDAEYKQLTDYFADMGSVIIPSQTFSTNVFNNSEIPLKQYPTSQIGSVGGYNIDFISVWSHPPTCPSIGTKLYGHNIQLILDGRPINPIPYRSIEDKCIVDSTQALIDTDTEEINKDYIRSLNLYNDPSGQRNYLTGPELKAYTGTTDYNSSSVMTFDNPNSFVLNFATNLPDAFHSGACILENSNRQANVRFLVGDVEKGDTSNNQDDALYFTAEYPYNLNVQNTALVSGFTCFCDCCIVLNYDRDRGTCFDGSLSWAAPYV